MTLKRHIVELIRLEGPITVARYMALCLGHPTLGYYTTRDPFGAAGDFTTAPEISQMFGELLGLWAAQVWLDMGAPADARLIEIGPGRGTLMADALRAISRAAPGMPERVDVVLVETSPTLRAAQQQKLAGAPARVIWAAQVEAALTGPAIILANELLDALPVHQFVRTPEGWRERMVGLDSAGGLVFGLAAATRDDIATEGPVGAVLEIPLASDALILSVAGHLAKAGGAALFIDYGSARTGFGDTLQAVKGHAFADPLAEPGQADLTTQVNFERAAVVARSASARAHPLITQAELLERLGLRQRAAALASRATPEQAAAIAEAVARLTDPGERGMGALFKALALSHPGLALPGFDSAPPTRQ